MSPHPAEEGPAQTTGTIFRARAEAHQRRYRRDSGLGWETYGHLLDRAAVEKGANFVHPAAREVVRSAPAAAEAERDMLSSRALASNLLAPLAASSEGLKLAADMLRPFIPNLVALRSIEIGYAPPPGVLYPERGPGLCDALAECELESGAIAVVDIVARYAEERFSRCPYRKAESVDPCPLDVVIGEDFTGCRHVSKEGALFWSIAREQHTMASLPVQQPGCPVGGAVFDLWRHHTLVHAEAARRRAGRALLVVMAPAGNDALLSGDSLSTAIAKGLALDGGPVISSLRRLVAEPDTVAFVPLERVLPSLERNAAALGADWARWGTRLRERYLTPSVRREATAHGKPPVSKRLLRVVEWMETEMFKRIVEVYDEASEGRGRIYYQPTESGVVMIALNDKVPRLTGLGTTKRASTLPVDALVPTELEAGREWEAFSKRIASSKKAVAEERGLARWLRRAVDANLELSELGDGWLFFAHAWKFVGDQVKKRNDVLAVHGPSGRLGIVELTGDPEKLHQARENALLFSRLWERDARWLAPLFTRLLRLMGKLHGSDVAAGASVELERAQPFAGVVSEEGVWIEAVRDE